MKLITELANISADVNAIWRRICSPLFVNFYTVSGGLTTRNRPVFLSTFWGGLNGDCVDSAVKLVLRESKYRFSRRPRLYASAPAILSIQVIICHCWSWSVIWQITFTSNGRVVGHKWTHFEKRWFLILYTGICQWSNQQVFIHS